MWMNKFFPCSAAQRGLWLEDRTARRETVNKGYGTVNMTDLELIR